MGSPVTITPDTGVTITPDQSAQQQPGFAARAAQQMGFTQHPIDQLVGELQQLKDHPISTLWQSIAQPITGLRDLTYGLVRHPIDTVQQVTGGKQFAEDVRSGNYRGALGTLAANAAQVGMLANPKAVVQAGQAATEAAGGAASRGLLLGRTPEEAYQSALKPSTTLSPTERAAVVQTGLQEKIPVTAKGLEDLSSKIGDLGQKIQATIDADPTRPISPAKAVQNLGKTEAKFATQVNPAADLAAIDASKQEFLNQFRSVPGGAVRNMTAEEAQAMKQGTYRALGSKAYGELKGASIEAQKALARGLKDEIAAQFPEIQQLNAKQGAMLDLQPVLERAVNRIGNHQLIGIGTPIAAGAAEAVTGSSKVGAVAGVLKAVLDNPAVKSRLAISLSKGAAITPAQAAARIDAYAAALRASTITSATGAAKVQTQQPNDPVGAGVAQFPNQ